MRTSLRSRLPSVGYLKLRGFQMVWRSDSEANTVECHISPKPIAYEYPAAIRRQACDALIHFWPKQNTVDGLSILPISRREISPEALKRAVPRDRPLQPAQPRSVRCAIQFQLKPTDLGGQLVGRQPISDIQESPSGFKSAQGRPVRILQFKDDLSRAR